MNDALGMDDRLDLRIFCAVKPLCLDDFVPFVEQCRAVDRDFRAHAPRGMFERVFRGHARDLFFGTVQKRTAACRKHQLRKNRISAKGQRLKNSGMFAVYGDEFDAVFFCFGKYDFAAAYEGFFVCKRDFFPRADGG